MLQLPLADIYSKISDKTSLSDSEISAKIDEKLNQLSGLVSREGAAHIVANELGVKLFEQVSGKVQIKNILVGMRSVETVGKIMAVYEVREFQSEKRSGKVGSFMLGDETGTIRVVCWNEQADNLVNIKEGGIIRLKGGYVKDNNNRKEVHLNERSVIVINPEGETIKEVKPAEPIAPNRKQIKDVTKNENNVALLATIVQAYEPKFFETCPECNRRIRPNEQNEFICQQHNKVKPSYAYVMNAVLDDGTETIRAVFFRNQANQLLKMDSDAILPFKEAPEKFEEIKNRLLGKIVHIVGRSAKNPMFGRVELIASDVNPDPDPEAEIKLLQQS